MWMAQVNFEDLLLTRSFQIFSAELMDSGPRSLLKVSFVWVWGGPGNHQSVWLHLAFHPSLQSVGRILGDCGVRFLFFILVIERDM